MQPILYELAGWNLKIHAYGVMMFLACSGALGISAWRARRERLEVSYVYGLAIWLFLGGALGARVLFVVTNPGTVHSSMELIMNGQGGGVFYGCIMGGLAGTLWYWRRSGFPFWPMADVAAPALAVGIALGRVGCFLGGCCFGSPCELPWAVRFPAGSHAWQGQVEQGILPLAAEFSLPVHPTQLYAAFAGVIILAVLSAYFPHRRRDGEVMALLMVLYPLTRWPIERLRGDEAPIFAGMTLSQNISVVLFVLGLIVWSQRSRLPPGRHADLAAADSVVGRTD